MKRLALLATILFILILAGCAAGPDTVAEAATKPPGFWLGFWHGMIAPFRFILSLFMEDVNVYEGLIIDRRFYGDYVAGFPGGLLADLAIFFASGPPTRKSCS